MLEFENLLIFISRGSIFKELRASIEADFLVLAYCHQAIFIGVDNIDKVDTVLHRWSDRVVILQFDLELTLVDDLLVLNLILNKRKFFLRDVQEVIKSLFEISRTNWLL
jgi:hypothetical protein